MCSTKLLIDSVWCVGHCWSCNWSFDCFRAYFSTYPMLHNILSGSQKIRINRRAEAKESTRRLYYSSTERFRVLEFIIRLKSPYPKSRMIVCIILIQRTDSHLDEYINWHNIYWRGYSFYFSNYATRNKETPYPIKYSHIHYPTSSNTVNS